MRLVFFCLPIGFELSCAESAGYVLHPQLKQCYAFRALRRSWRSARQECIDAGGELVAIHSAQENMFVTALILERQGAPSELLRAVPCFLRAARARSSFLLVRSDFNGQRVWIGLVDARPNSDEMLFQWTSGEPVRLLPLRTGRQ